MNFTRWKCFLVLLLLTIIEVGPIPMTGLIGLYIVLFRPFWFKRVVDKVYNKKDEFYY